ncbi:MAG: hypothetical protein KC544_15660 [Gemmatimonadetes bacterium]|nr:hypothetical protein [Gemmatimonadota bacterium]
MPHDRIGVRLTIARACGRQPRGIGGLQLHQEAGDFPVRATGEVGPPGEGVPAAKFDFDRATIGDSIDGLGSLRRLRHSDARQRGEQDEHTR